MVWCTRGLDSIFREANLRSTRARRAPSAELGRMRVAGDTSPEADAVQTQGYRRMGGPARAETLFRLM